LFSAEAVAFYTVPFNLVSRASVIPGALTASLFPKLSRSSQEHSAQLASDAVAALAAVMTPIFVLTIAALPVFMRHWVGAGFAGHAAPLGIILLVGVWVNGLAYVPYGQLQASGRPDIPAKFHAAELIPFLGILWLGLHYFGLVGAAYAWSLRVAVDALLLFRAGGRIPRWHRLIPGGLMVILAGCSAPTFVLSVKTAYELGLLVAASIWSWHLSPAIRSVVRGRLKVPSIRSAV
jgi:O-antigen/teichoic acid export membrane protein